MSTVDQTTTSRTRRSLVAGSVGNFVEWYEFGVYGFFATVIAANFFSTDGEQRRSRAWSRRTPRSRWPSSSARSARPCSAGSATGSAAGPTLILVLLLMTGATTLIGVLPTYATVGAAAPVAADAGAGRCRGCPRAGSSAARCRS